MKNFGEKEAWAYPGTAQFFRVPPVISGTAKAAIFNRNKSPLKISGKVAVGIVGVSGTPENFQGTHTYGASRGHLCDSSAFLYAMDQIFAVKTQCASLTI